MLPICVPETLTNATSTRSPNPVGQLDLRQLSTRNSASACEEEGRGTSLNNQAIQISRGLKQRADAGGVQESLDGVESCCELSAQSLSRG
jgi:hypothetical protein